MSNPSQSLPLILPTKKDQAPGQQGYDQQVNLVVSAATQYGTTQQRPTMDLFIGRTFFDTTLKSIVVWDGTMWISSAQSTNPFETSALNGQLLIGATGTSPVLNTLTPGDGITIINNAGNISISAQDIFYWAAAYG